MSCLTSAIPLNEEHLRRLIRESMREAIITKISIHDSLGKDTPYGRAVETKPSPQATVISTARLGGLHHRYHWHQAA